MSKTERKWLIEVLKALKWFLTESAKLLKEFRLAVFRKIENKNDRIDKALFFGLLALIWISWMVAVYRGGW